MVKMYLRERIGNPDFFVGRKEEMSFFLNWIEEIKQEFSKSTVLLARRKLGKTAIMERLYNLTFAKNDRVVPFYYEIRERSLWELTFANEFFFSFIYQYIAFKTQKLEHLYFTKNKSFPHLKQTILQEKLNYLLPYAESVELLYQNKDFGLWDLVQNLPHLLAQSQNEYIVQMIDEFQFLGKFIYRDEACKDLIDDFAGSYLGTAESKIAPMLISGSWVGWLMEDLRRLLPTRFRFEFLPDLPKDEAIEMVFKYSQIARVPVTDETAYILAEITEGSPFYISAILRSRCKGKDLTTEEGVLKALEFETFDDRGEIRTTWMEYIHSAFSRTNGDSTKKIILYLSKHRNQEWTRKEIKEKLNLEYTDQELERRLKSLVKNDIIQQGENNFRYRGVPDNIFDKVFRGTYQEEIQTFYPPEISEEKIQSFSLDEIGKGYQTLYQKFKHKYHKVLGEYNRYKGYYAEYWIIQEFQHRVQAKDEFFQSITENLPSDFHFCEYSSVWSYRATPQYTRELQIDLFARAANSINYSVIGEIKNRESKKFDLSELLEFEKKLAVIIEVEQLEKSIGFIYSRKGLTAEAEKRCQEQGIAYSSNERWLGEKLTEDTSSKDES